MQVSTFQPAGRHKQAQPTDFTQGLSTYASWVCCPELSNNSCNPPETCQLGRWAEVQHYGSHMLAEQALTLLPTQHS